MTKLLTLLVFLALSGSTMAFIVGGTEVEEGSWQNVVAITSSKGNIFCSGTAIDQKTIKTAAHCLLNPSLTEMVVKSVFPLYAAFYFKDAKNPEDELKRIQAGPQLSAIILKLIERMKNDPEALSLEFGEEKDFIKNFISDAKTRFKFAEKALAVGLYYSIQDFRIYSGQGQAGGKVQASEIKVADYKIDSAYFNMYLATVAQKLGLISSQQAMEYSSLIDSQDKLTITTSQELPLEKENIIPTITMEELEDIDFDQVKLVGFGRTVDPNLEKEDPDYGVKREVEVKLLSFKDGHYITQAPMKSACYGDSGGAAFVKLKSTNEWRYLGIIHGGANFEGFSEENAKLDYKNAFCGTEKIATLIVPAL